MITRRWIGIALYTAGMVVQVVAFVSWLRYRLATPVFVREVTPAAVSLIVVGIALVAEAAAEKRGFDVHETKKRD